MVTIESTIFNPILLVITVFRTLAADLSRRKT